MALQAWEHTVNNNLPISSFRQQIVDAVTFNQVTIITAETGAGKSTQVPQFLLEAEHKLVVTQPRRLAARTVAQRVAWELGEELGETIGLRTRDDKVVGPNNRCLFATDGLAMVRSLLSQSTASKTLVLDEVHEWNLNMEVLVAWVKLQVSQNPNFKAVLMSATLEADRLSEFFNGAPVIKVPGRQYPVEIQGPMPSIPLDVERMVRQNRNVLVFMPGKTEINEVVKDLTDMHVQAEILPLHGELTPTEQAKCFKHYGRSKVVVSTNVAQTSVTIDDIDAVIDSGMEKRKELVDGVEGLYIKPISIADSNQRKGRAGRTKPGIYIDHCAESDRLDFPIAEIHRTRLDQTVLRLAEAEIDAEELEFFHQPDKAQIHEAKQVLKMLGCLDNQGHVTKMGHRIAQMPVNVKYGRMIIEAERLDVVGDILDIAAILEYGQEITMRKEYGWQSLTEGEVESDLIAQAKVFNKALDMKKEELQSYKIHLKAFFKVKEIRNVLQDNLVGKVQSMDTTGDRVSIMKAIVAGMIDHVFIQTWGDQYVNGSGSGPRRLNQFSLVYSPTMLVGVPFDLEYTKKLRFGGEVKGILNLINLATVVKEEWLPEVAPQLYRVETGIDPIYESFNQTVTSERRTYLGDRLLSSTRVPDPNHPQAAQLKVEYEERLSRPVARSTSFYDTLAYQGQVWANRYGRAPLPSYVPVQEDPEVVQQREARRKEEQLERERQFEEARTLSQKVQELQAAAKEFKRLYFRKLDVVRVSILSEIEKGPERFIEDQKAWLEKNQPRFDKIKEAYTKKK